jgi:hypothetical protein
MRLETTDGREISRLTFNIRMADTSPGRDLVREMY